MNIIALRKPEPKRIVLVDLQYPYGKKKVYLNGSLYATAARMLAAGHAVELIDLNIDDFDNPRVQSIFSQADLIGVSVIGSPYLPSAIEFARQITNRFQKPIMFGGQVIAKLDPSQFTQPFAGTMAMGIRDDNDLAAMLECGPSDLPSAFSVSFAPVWQQMAKERLKHYLEREFSLVVSQGCKYQCDFCGAAKKMREQHVQLDIFRADMLFLAQAADEFGLPILECYASSLDFFQNPRIVSQHLRVLAEVQEQTGIQFKVRCLSCLDSFLAAKEEIPDLANLLRRAGLWCIGFGADGTDEAVWKAQRKTQNDVADIARCLDSCAAMGVRPELLMVLGFRQDTIRSLWKNLKNSVRYAWTWPVVIRPYLAKPFIPGSEGWQTETERVQGVIDDPRKFFNLDFCAIGSRLTHPNLWHRWACNTTYLAIIALLTPFGRCVTSPLLPQGESGWRGRFYQKINHLMPEDR